MEIGKVGELSTYEKQYYTRKVISLSITAFILIVVLVFVTIVNYTSLFERKMFQHIADKYGYELSYSNAYELWAKDNAKQGNYIELSDPKNNIYILFRYDEKNTEVVKNIGSNSKENKFYRVNTPEPENNIQNEKVILNNINTEFGTTSNLSVTKDKANIGTGYNIVKMDSIMKQHRIDYVNNLLTDNKKQSKQSSNSKIKIDLNKNKKISTVKNKKTISLDKWFKYNNTINYKLAILKSVAETPSESVGLTGPSINFAEENSAYNNKVTTVIKVKESGNKEKAEKKDAKKNKKNTSKSPKSNVDAALQGFINDKENLVNEYGSSKYSTYTSMILSSNNKKENEWEKIFVSGETSKGYCRGIIIGTCENNDVAKQKMETTLNLLVIVSYLERTIIL